ncbi:MAG: diacylglycerol kinase family lipid kinase [Dehalococcoidales bacterium]|nr:diacylglycerol kinase family lipid kinase [Dehalococcoidales bacterium]
MLHTKLIVNPIAGAGRTLKKWPHISDLLKSIGLRFEHDITEAPKHAIELARAAVRKGYELVVCVGGDGTINEVVNGLYDSGAIKDVTLGIISTGTGSDYIRTIGIPPRYEDSCQRLLNPTKLQVDIGVVEYTSNSDQLKRLFVNFAGLGFDAEVVRSTTQKYKALGGMPAYLLGLLTTLLCYKNRDITLKLDGQVQEKRVCSVVASNGKYGGGSMLMAPDADPSDGLFDVLTIDDLSKPDLLWSLPRIYKGTHLTHPKVTMTRAREVEIEARQRIFLQADGELLGEAPARFSLLPSALNIAV